MDLFHRALVVRLRSYHDKYLYAKDDEESVKQDHNGASRNARWTVEVVEGIVKVLRLRSCHGKYLTASNERFLLGAAGQKVTQTLPARLDSSIEWEPIKEGNLVRLKTRYGNYLKANAGLPPYHNSVTHDNPHSTITQDWVLWHVDVVEIQVPAPIPAALPRPAEPVEPDSPRFEPMPSFNEPIHRVEGRVIHFQVLGDDGTVDDSIEWPQLTFNGTSVAELTERLKELTGLNDLIICTINPRTLDRIPLRLGLPPGANMRLVVIDANSKAGRALRGDSDD